MAHFMQICKNFPRIRNSALPESAPEDLSKCLVKFDSRATADNLKSELKQSPLEECTIRTVEEGPDGKEEDKKTVSPAKSAQCAVFRFSKDSTCSHILAYTFLLTLSITQVACERSFSMLKYIKSKLRSCLSSSHLEGFMLMAIEKDILVDSDTIIDRVAEKSEMMKTLLL